MRRSYFYYFAVTLTILISTGFGCRAGCKNKNLNTKASTQMNLKNENMKDYVFLEGMYQDPFFPKRAVDKVKAVLIELCHQIEQQHPGSPDELYALTDTATEKINNLQEEFFEADSELETGAAEIIAMDFAYIANTYGFEADVEELIRVREW